MLVLLHLMQNVWRPALISRIDQQGDEKQGATLMSVQSQAQSVAVMMLAPLLGISIDLNRAGAGPGLDSGQGNEFWPIAACGLLLTLIFVRAQLSRPR